MKEEVNVYDAFDWLGKRVKLRRLTEKTDRTESWFSQKLNHHSPNGTPLSFDVSDIPMLQKAWNDVEQQVSIRLFVSSDDKDVRRANWLYIREMFLSDFFCMVLGCSVSYLDNRLRSNSKTRFTDDEIARMNAAIQATAMQMRNTVLVV